MNTNTTKIQRLELLLQRSIPFLFRAAHFSDGILRLDIPPKIVRERCIELLNDIIEEVPRLGGTRIDGKVD